MPPRGKRRSVEPALIAVVHLQSRQSAVDPERHVIRRPAAHILDSHHCHPGAADRNPPVLHLIRQPLADPQRRRRVHLIGELPLRVGRCRPSCHRDERDEAETRGAPRRAAHQCLNASILNALRTPTSCRWSRKQTRRIGRVAPPFTSRATPPACPPRRFPPPPPGTAATTPSEWRPA